MHKCNMQPPNMIKVPGKRKKRKRQFKLSLQKMRERRWRHSILFAFQKLETVTYKTSVFFKILQNQIIEFEFKLKN